MPRIKREVTVGDLVALLMAAIALLGWAVSRGEAMSDNRAAFKSIEATIASVDKKHDGNYAELAKYGSQPVRDLIKEFQQVRIDIERLRVLLEKENARHGD